MQAVMDRLERFVARRRWWVLAFWIVLVLVAVPFASRQTEDLTGGGFESKGSTSQVVAQALQAKEFEGASAESLSVVFDNRAHDARGLDAAIGRVQRDALKGVEAISVDPQALEQARSSKDDVVIVPLVVTGNRDQAVDGATTMRENLNLSGEGAVPIHLVGQSALWAGLQEVSKEDLEQAEGVGLPIVLIILLIVFGSLAAAALPLALGVPAVLVTGAVLCILSQQMHM
jgi:RND superfamily putative drug exporter